MGADLNLAGKSSAGTSKYSPAKPVLLLFDILHSLFEAIIFIMEKIADGHGDRRLAAFDAQEICAI
jgi:hypothetical protein